MTSYADVESDVKPDVASNVTSNVDFSLNSRNWWLASNLLAVLLGAALIYLWVQMETFWVDENIQLTNMQQVEGTISEQYADSVNYADLKKLPTGLFIQSLKFLSASEVNISGYLWQHFPLELYRGVENSDIEPNFVFPEQVNSGSDISPVIAYRKKSVYGEVIGWYFESTIKQNFDYSAYPFDHKTVWVRLWPSDFSRNIVLVPDFDAYDSTDHRAVFGIERNIVLGPWVRENTYFDYKPSSYDTNFGIDEYIGQKNFPELHYNIVVKRRFHNAFIVYLLPLVTVMVLLFASMLTVSDSKRTGELLGFSTSGFLGMCSALFFVVMMAHIHLREKFAGSGVVYLEIFYILMYVMLALATVNTYLFAIRPKFLEPVILYKDNLIPKVCFWPVILLSLVITTLFFL